LAHIEQKEFCLKVKEKFPQYFDNQKVLEIGSLNINGTLRDLFTNCNYTGIDVGEGDCVDIVCVGHLFDAPDNSFDVVCSAESLEHDMFWGKTLLNSFRMLRSGGLYLMTCATTDRPIHGTRSCSPCNAPLLENLGEWGDYYKNLTEEDIRSVINPDEIFSEYLFEVNNISHDLYFFGIKK
jgi:SAM-dependent methyltransferase